MSQTTPHSQTDRLDGAVCPRCSCFCDDIRLRYGGGEEVVAVERACELGESWLRRARTLSPRALVDGKPHDLEAALERTATLLVEAEAPALLGFHGLSLEAVQQAIGLALTLRSAVLPCPPPAPERAGLDAPECMATLGEVRASADLVVYWRADPLASHPRHLERYSLDPPLLSGKGREIVVIDTAEALARSRTATRASQVLTITCDLPGAPGADTELALDLGAFLEGKASATGARPIDRREDVARLAAKIRSASHTHIFLGGAAARDAVLRDATHGLAARIRRRHRLTLSALTSPGNERAVAECLTSMTGSAGPLVHFSAGDSGPTWLPGALDLETLLEHQGADLILVLGLETPDTDRLSPLESGARRLRLGPFADESAAVSFVVPGLDPRLAATVMRPDGVLLTLCGATQAGPRDPAADLLAEMNRRVALVEKEVAE